MARILIVASDAGGASVQASLQSVGHTVTLVAPSEAPSMPSTGRDVIVAFNLAGGAAGENAATPRDYQIWLADRWSGGCPLIVGGPIASSTYNRWTAARLGIATPINYLSAITGVSSSVDIVHAHPVTAGYSGRVQVRSGADWSVQFAEDAASTTLTTLAAEPTRMSLIVRDAGAATVPGGIGPAIAPARAAAIGWLPRVDSSLTAAGLQLLNQLIDWLAPPAPPSITGTVTAIAPSPAVSIAGVTPIAGQVTATAPAPVVNVDGEAVGPTTGTVAATAPAPAVSIEGDVPEAITGLVTATAPRPVVRVVEQAGTSATLQLGLSVDVTDVQLVNIVTLPEVTIPLALRLDVTHTVPVVRVPGEVTIPLGMSLTARPEDTSGVDARTGLIPWRYIITDLHGNQKVELTKVTHGPVKDGINEPATMELALPTGHPGRAFMQPIERQCLVMRGNQVLLRGPILPGRVSDNGATITHTIHDPSWYWRGGRRVIGRVPKKNLLYNGDFTHGLRGWTPGYDADSIPAAKPKVSIVDDDFTDGGKALQITGVESVTQTKSVLDSTAVYYPNRPFAWEPLAAGFKPGGAAKVDTVAKAMPETKGLKVTIIGHTANDGTGNGLKLSLRRAEAAKARVLALRPNAIVTTKGVGFYDPDPKYPIDSAQQRRVEISYESVETITGESRQWVRQTLTLIQPKTARYELDLTAAAWLKVTDDWSVEDANMVTVKIVARRKSKPNDIWDEASTSISDSDPVDRWGHEYASVTIPPDGREYLIDVFLYAPAALARYTRVALVPGEALYYWGTDQASIVKGLVQHMQDPAMGKQWPLVIGTRTPKTGVLRDRIYPHHERMPLETALDEWGTLHRGMDVDVLTTPAETIVATYYPRQGQVLDLALVQGRDITTATPATTSDVGSSIIAQAQDSGPARDEAYAEDARAFGGLRLERVITGEQETPINELDETALGELAWANASTIAWWVTINPDRIGWVLANTSKGDSVRLQLEHPDPVDTLARIVRRENHPTSLRLMLAKEA